MQGLRVSTYAGWTCALWLVMGCASDERPGKPVDAGMDAAASIDGAVDGQAPPILDAGQRDGSAQDGAASDAAPPDAGGDGSAPDEYELLVPEVLAPSYLGILVGPGMEEPQAGLRLYGTDLGISFEHGGELQILFGDSWAHDEQVCGDAPLNDDTLAQLPMTFGGDIPVVSFATDPAAQNETLAIDLIRDGESLSMGFGQVPMAAFSDGENAFAFFARLAPQSCGESLQCGSEPTLACSDRIGECQPAYTTMTLSCDLASQLGCLPGQECVAGEPVCFDPSSAQYDGSIFGENVCVAQGWSSRCRARACTSSARCIRGDE